MDRSRVVDVVLCREFIDDPGKYPFTIPSVAKMSSLPLHPEVTFLVGENGSGKSTLLEAIAIAAGCNPEGGSRNLKFSTRDSHSALGHCLRLVQEIGPRGIKDVFFLRAESFYNTATAIEESERSGPSTGFKYYGGKSPHEQSHGESFFATVQHRFGPNGFYLLDEPESALSPTRQLSLLTAINDLTKKHAQFVIATHSPILMAFPRATIYELGSWGIRAASYEETEHYKVTRAFLLRRDKMLDELFQDPLGK